jgi:hypothetical protein
MTVVGGQKKGMWRGGEADKSGYIICNEMSQWNLSSCTINICQKALIKYVVRGNNIKFSEFT